ncbi:MAG TPA: hypothetical protein VNM24_17055 [Burkholderiales bacterium]|nr:hypothetical protein [Burkholderiales bacterium]
MTAPFKTQLKAPLLGAAIASLLSASAAAIAQSEVEPNDTKDQAQVLVIPSSSVSVTGMIGSSSGGMTTDFDLYAFNAKNGDVPVITIVSDAAWDTYLVLYSATGEKLVENDDAVTMNPGSSSPFDSRIESFRIDADGTYYVGVTPVPRYPGPNFSIINTSPTNGGAYTLTIEGVTPTEPSPGPDPTPQPPPPTTTPGGDARVVTIKVRHRHWDDDEPENRVYRRIIPVAVLSAHDFNAFSKIDRHSLTFGATGTEDSLARCRKRPKDVNHDGLPDLVCFFKTEQTGFGVGDAQGFLNGATKDGEKITGSASLKVYQLPKKKHEGWHKRHKVDPYTGKPRWR